MPGVFLAGWAREASTGLVGAARKDGIIAARVMLEYLETLGKARPSDDPISMLKQHFAQVDAPVVDKQHIIQLEEIEQQRTEEMGIPEFKFSANADMLAAVGLAKEEAQG